MFIIFIFMGLSPVMIGLSLLNGHTFTAGIWLAVWVVTVIATRDR